MKTEAKKFTTTYVVSAKFDGVLSDQSLAGLADKIVRVDSIDALPDLDKGACVVVDARQQLPEEIEGQGQEPAKSSLSKLANKVGAVVVVTASTSDLVRLTAPRYRESITDDPATGEKKKQFVLAYKPPKIFGYTEISFKKSAEILEEIHSSHERERKASSEVKPTPQIEAIGAESPARVGGKRVIGHERGNGHDIGDAKPTRHGKDYPASKKGNGQSPIPL